jgi:hypothetical protein
MRRERRIQRRGTATVAHLRQHAGAVYFRRIADFAADFGESRNYGRAACCGPAPLESAALRLPKTIPER